MSSGKIRVQSENIFPIIKKFLYSDHEIFLRELVSNAVDATQKLKVLANLGKTTVDASQAKITIKLDKEAKNIHIIDEGIGMTAEEVDKYLNQMAFSGAEDFLAKFKGQSDQNIIGHFGLGFYSSFMVSEKVSVITKSHEVDSQAVIWECDGSPEYSLENYENKTVHGTEIVLHVDKDSEEFLDAWRLKSILNKFCKFLPIPIYFEDIALQNEEKVDDEEKTDGEEKAAAPTPINNPHPAWVRKPSELTPEDYQAFFRELYPMDEAPMFWIHLNVDYPFNLTGILFFPKIKHSYEIQKDKVQLYCNQVFVTDQVKDIVPEFLMLLQGVIDSPDIPLNVSRSYLQGDANVKKISSYITKKVADKLDELFKADRKAYEEKWESLGLFVKYGMMTDDKFYDKAKQFLIVKDAKEDKYYTFEEYIFATETLQKNAEGKTVVLYSTDAVQQNSYIKAATDKGYMVVALNDLIDASWIGHMESKYENIGFCRVDADIAENLIDKKEAAGTNLSAEETEKIIGLFKTNLTDSNAKIELKEFSADASPVIATKPEFMRRMKDMANQQGANGMMQFYAQMPDEVNFTINTGHPVVKQAVAEADEAKQNKMVQNLLDMALLSQGSLKGENLTRFIERTVELMG